MLKEFDPNAIDDGGLDKDGDGKIDMAEVAGLDVQGVTGWDEKCAENAYFKWKKQVLGRGKEGEEGGDEADGDGEKKDKKKKKKKGEKKNDDENKENEDGDGEKKDKKKKKKKKKKK